MRKKNLAWTGMKVRAFDRMNGRDIFTWNPYNPQKPSLIDMFLLYFLLYLLSSYLFCACLSPCREGRDLGVFYTALQGATLDTAPDFAPIYPQIRTPQVICSLSKCFDGFVLSQNQSARRNFILITQWQYTKHTQTRPDVNVSILGWIVMFDDSHLPKYQS